MNQIIGTCSICGGAVTKDFGSYGGSRPIASCQRCGAIENIYHLQNSNGHLRVPTIPMRPNPRGVVGGGGSGGGGVLQAENDRLKKVNQELLEALSELSEFCKELGFSWSCLAQARAALAKATGEQA